MITMTRWEVVFLCLSIILSSIILGLIPKEQIIVENINLKFEPGALEIADKEEDIDLVQDYPTPNEIEALLINQ